MLHSRNIYGTNNVTASKIVNILKNNDQLCVKFQKNAYLINISFQYEVFENPFLLKGTRINTPQKMIPDIKNSVLKGH